MSLDFAALSVADLCAGYAQREGRYTCLYCDAVFQEGEVYPLDGRFYEAGRAAAAHVAAAHGGPLAALLGSDSKYVALTPAQRELLQLLHAGASDADIARQTGVAASTVRHQKFMLREKGKQAKALLALLDLALSQRPASPDDILPVPPTAKMVDDRYITTAAERDKILQAAFSSFQPLRLTRFPPKEKKKLAILTRIAQEFQAGRTYTEPEVNDILRAIFADYVTLRRYLIEYGFMDRTRDCKAYWLK